MTIPNKRTKCFHCLDLLGVEQFHIAITRSTGRLINSDNHYVMSKRIHFHAKCFLEIAGEEYFSELIEPRRDKDPDATVYEYL